MQIALNGQRHELSAPVSVLALLGTLGLDPRLVAVEVNRVVVKRERYPTTTIDEGAEVEIVAFVGGGARGTITARRALGAGLVLLVLGTGVHIAAAQQPRAAQTGPVTDEASLIAQGWSLLAQGKAGEAATQAALVLSRYPLSAAGVALSVEADIARVGAIAGLDTYERWLGARKLDDAYVLRRVARAALWEAARNKQAAETRLEGLKGLAADGDAEAQAELAQTAFSGGLSEAGALASMGNERAVRVLIADLKTKPGRQLRTIAALGESHSKIAIAALIDVLADPNLDNRAAAAAALGALGATEAIDKIKPLLDPSGPFPVRVDAATALFRLHDMSGLSLLRDMETSEHAGIRLEAAKATAGQPDAEWLNLVQRTIADPEATVRLDAAVLLAPYDHETAKATLERLLGDDNVAVREAAALAYITKVATDFADLRRFLRLGGTMRVRAANRILELTR